MNDENKVSRRSFLKKSAIMGAGLLASSSILAACGDTATPGTTATTAAATTTTAATTTSAATSAAATTAATTTSAVTSVAAAGKPVEITHWDWWVTQAPAIDAEIKLFQQANPGITVKKVSNPGGNYDDLFALAQKSGDAPDTFLISNKTNNVKDWASKGWLADLSQFPDFNDFKNTFPDKTQNFVEGVNVVKGKVYSAPHDATFTGMWYQLYVNTKVLKDAGIVDSSGNAKLPETADDMFQMSSTIKDKSGGKVYGLGWGGKSDFVWSFPVWIAQLSGVDTGQDGLDYKTGKYAYSSNPAYKTALDFMVKMRNSNLILPESASIDDEGARAEFAAGKFAFLVAGTWVINGWQTTNPNFNDYTITHPPFFNTNTPKSYYYISPGGMLFGLNPNSKNADAAWKWYKWLYSKDAGVRWVKTNNGFSIFPEANQPDYIQNTALQNYVKIAPNFVKYGPQPGLRNPDTGLVKFPDVKPNLNQVVQGIFTGQLPDVSQALKSLNDAKQKGFDQALSDAVAAGAKVSASDFAFPDWDLMQDYTNNSSK